MADKISFEKINSFSGKYNESMFWNGLQKVCATLLCVAEGQCVHRSEGLDYGGFGLFGESH